MWPDYVLVSGQQALISARGLYQSFGHRVDRYFPDWFNHRVSKLALVADRHYRLKKLFRGRIDYLLTLKTAQQLATYEKDPTGHYRQQLATLAECLQKEGIATDFGDALNEVAMNLEGLKDTHGRSLELFPTPKPAKPKEVTLQRPIVPVPISGLTPAQVILQAAQLLVEHEQKLNALQSQLGQLVAIHQQSAVQLMGLPSTMSPPQQTVRSRIRELVNEYCHVNRLHQDQVYPQIYHKLLYGYNINVKAYKRGTSETYLDVAERHGFLDKVLLIVTHYFKANAPRTSSADRPESGAEEADDDQPF
ncbi:hypothetical protein GCM10027299_09230 [Larkinella ripae]